MIKAGIIGATGYAGVELVRILLAHPKAEISAIGSVSYTGKKLGDIYPSMANLIDLPLAESQQVIEQSDVVFLSLPHGHSEEIAEAAFKQGKKVVDLGADFRLISSEEYTHWYGAGYKAPHLHENVPYGLPELFRDNIKNANLVANPGCYPTAAALGLAPLIKEIGTSCPIMIDAKSGVTGAGRTPTETTHFPQCNENIAPYKVASHRHTPEIEQSLNLVSGGQNLVAFVPHLVPLNRGILSTMYVKPDKTVTAESLYEIYADYYKNEEFIRLMEIGQATNLNQVTGSNYCDISLHFDKRTGYVMVVSAIDNMVKGAAGQAVQNMNIIFDIQENTGLKMAPLAF